MNSQGKSGPLRTSQKQPVDSALGAAEKLAAEGISAEVLSICTIKPLDDDVLIALMACTVFPHGDSRMGGADLYIQMRISNGIADLFSDCLSEKLPTRVKRLGMQDVFGESGPAAELVAKYGLDAEGVFKSVKAFVKG